MKKRNNKSVRRAWREIGLFCDVEIKARASFVRQVEQKPPEKTRKGKAKK